MQSPKYVALLFFIVGLSVFRLFAVPIQENDHCGELVLSENVDDQKIYKKKQAEVTVEEASIKGDSLYVTVSYQTKTLNPCFTLFWDNSDNFKKDKVNLMLIHSNPASKEGAEIHQNISFDLTAIKSKLNGKSEIKIKLDTKGNSSELIYRALK